MSQDDFRRGSRGVVASLIPAQDGGYRLVLDDVASTSTTYPQEWMVKNLFTYKDFDGARILNSDLSDQELADIGLSLVARLAAFEEVSKSSKKS